MPAGLYALVVGWLTWPLGRDLATHFPDTWPTARTDPPAIAWALAHQTRALLDPMLGMADGRVCHPEPRSLLFVERGIGALPVFAPVFWATANPILALNVVFLAGVVATMTALHWVVHRWSGSHLAGAAAAIVFVSPAWTLRTWLPVAPNYAQLQYLPLTVFLGARARLGMRSGLLLAALLALAGLASPYVAAAVAAPVAVVGMGALARRRSRRGGVVVLGALALAGAVWLLAYGGHAAVVSDDPGLLARSVWAHAAQRPAPLPWGLAAIDAATAIPLVVVPLVVAGAVAGSVRRRGDRAARRVWCHAAVWLVVGVLASLPPVVAWDGRRVLLPHAWLVERLPALAVLRFPNRLAASALVGACLLVGLAVGEIVALPRRRRVIVLCGVAALVVAARAAGVRDAPGARALAMASVRYPLWRPPPLAPAVEALIEARGGPLIEVPIGPVRGPVSPADTLLNARAMLHAVVHRQRLVNCYASYTPPGADEIMQLARRLPDPGALAALRRRTGLRTIVVRPALYGALEREACARRARGGRPPAGCAGHPGAAERRAWVALAAEGGADGLCLLLETKDTLVFAAEPCAPRRAGGPQRQPATIATAAQCTVAAATTSAWKISW